MSGARRAARAGFTLLEVLIALALLAVVVTATMALFRGVLNSWQTGELRADRYQQARVALELLTRDLRSSYVDAGLPFVGLPAGVAGFRADAVGSELFFVARIAGAGPTELVEVGYWLRGEDNTLVRHIDTEPDWDFTTMESDDELIGSVDELSFLYYDGGQWLSAWDARAGGAEAGRLPQGVEVRLTVGDPKTGARETFTSTVKLPLGG